MLRWGTVAVIAAAMMAAVASVGSAAEQLRVDAWVVNPTWGVDRGLRVAYEGPQESGDRLWISRDRGTGACPATPSAQTTRGVRWLLGRPGRGVPAVEGYFDDRRHRIAAPERGRQRVCAWVRQESIDDEIGDWVTTWAVTQDSVILRRVVPTKAERRRGVRQIRAEMRRASRVWHRMGLHTKTVGPKFSRIDPTFAVVGVVGATRADQMRVQGGHAIYHLRNGRWHRLGPIMGDTSRWCDVDGGSAGQVPDWVLNGFFGQGVCR